MLKVYVTTLQRNYYHFKFTYSIAIGPMFYFYLLFIYFSRDDQTKAS